jgi:RNA polymerase sigma-70 factor (ECF subfamily)
MATDPNPTTPGLGRRLRTAMLGVLGDVGTDGELLDRFVRTRDDTVFAELVRRLGPMVQGVCRGVLGPGPDADDAFQATFVVLARKAEKVRPPGRVAAWVYGVATLAARKARHARRKRAWREAELSAAVDPPGQSVSIEPDLGPALAEEIGKLPDKYRLPVVLCLVRELTAARAAADLGWPVGTVTTRLARGRAILGDRLIRRGLGLTAVAAAAGSGLSADFVHETTHWATAGAAAVPARILTLSAEVIAAMTLSKIRLAVAAGLLLAAVAVPGVGRLTVPTTHAAAPPPTAAAAPKDPLDRIKLTRLTTLLMPDGIQQDLGLTEDQKTKIADARKKLSDDMQATFRGQVAGGAMRVAPPAAGGGGGGGGVIVGGAMAGSAFAEVNKAMVEHQAAFDKTVLAALSEAQVHRLKQIFLQTQGAAGLLDRRVIRALELTADQEDEIEKLLPVTPIVGRGMPDERVKEIDDALAAAVKVLTPGQKEKWTTLIGKPVPTAVLLIAAGPPSGFGTFSVAGGAVGGPAGVVPPAPQKK